MDVAAVEAHGLTRTFGSIRALDGLELSVAGGEVLGLVGPNGAGKTTFIRIVAGLLRPSAGSVNVLGMGRPSPTVAPHVGYMTQAAALYEDLSVQTNLVFFGRLYGMVPAEARRRADDLVEALSLADKRRVFVRDISGGQRQLANLACALMHRPRLLLLDEPTVGVDPELRRRLWDLFGEMNESGTTILLTTHVMDEAERCDRVTMVAEGRAIATGTPDELRRAASASTLEDAYLQFATSSRGAG